MEPARPAAEDTGALLARVAAGDREAFGRFYDATAALAFGLIRRIVRDSAAAEEVAQEVFLQVWRDAARYDPRRGTAEAWLVTRARSRAIDRLRAARRRERPLAGRADGPAEPAEDADAAAAAEERGRVQSALQRLPAPQRRVIELAFFEGLTQAEIAAQVGAPLGTVKTRARLGLERLRGLFAEQGDRG